MKGISPHAHGFNMNKTKLREDIERMKAAIRAEKKKIADAETMIKILQDEIKIIRVYLSGVRR